MSFNWFIYLGRQVFDDRGLKGVSYFFLENGEIEYQQVEN